MAPDAHRRSVLPLDEGLYKLDSVFFKQQTGIDDNDELKTHLLSIQAEAYNVTRIFFCTWPLSDPTCKVKPYPCIRRFSWARY